MLAQLAIRLLVAFAPGDIPRLPEAALNLESFGFAAGAAAVWPGLGPAEGEAVADSRLARALFLIHRA